MIGTVGTFDGVHAGHRYLLDTLTALAREKGEEAAIFVLADHPLRLVAPERVPPQLMTRAEKLGLIGELYPEARIVPLDFTPELRALTHRGFMQKIADEFGVNRLLVGHDNRFGSDRDVTPDRYADTGRELGMEVIMCPSLPDVSSTVLRHLLLDEGDAARFGELARYPYMLQGHVEHGQAVGRTIGFPTANLRPDDPFKLIPRRGVYAAVALLDGRQYPAVVNIGVRPTLGEAAASPTIEAHLLTPEPLDLYGKPLALSFMARLRDERRFPSLEELRRQIETDSARALKILPLLPIQLPLSGVNK